tara:strand:- start:574 stop:789 length:216 start_codon:yes stop_codon:yes gene_type:complete
MSFEIIEKTSATRHYKITQTPTGAYRLRAVKRDTDELEFEIVLRDTDELLEAKIMLQSAYDSDVKVVQHEV